MGLPPAEGSTSQVVVIRGVYEIEPSDEPGWVRLTTSVTLSSLESGCDRIHFYQPDSRDLEVLDPERFLRVEAGPSKWVLYPRVPYAPLQVFSVRVTCLQKVVPSLDGSGADSILIPFNIRTSGICIRYITGGER